MSKIDGSVSLSQPAPVPADAGVSASVSASFSSTVSGLSGSGVAATAAEPSDAAPATADAGTGLGGPNLGDMGPGPVVGPLPATGSPPSGSGDLPLGGREYQKHHEVITHARQNINQMMDRAKTQFADGNISAGIYTQNAVKPLETLLESLIASGRNGHLTRSGANVMRENIQGVATKLGGIELAHPYPQLENPPQPHQSALTQINDAMNRLLAMKGDAATVQNHCIAINQLETSLLNASPRPNHLSQAAIETLKERVNGFYNFEGEPLPFT